jgi:hypothetical protein
VLLPQARQRLLCGGILREEVHAVRDSLEAVEFFGASRANIVRTHGHKPFRGGQVSFRTFTRLAEEQLLDEETPCLRLVKLCHVIIESLKSFSIMHKINIGVLLHVQARIAIEEGWVDNWLILENCALLIVVNIRLHVRICGNLLRNTTSQTR